MCWDRELPNYSSNNEIFNFVYHKIETAYRETSDNDDEGEFYDDNDDEREF